MDLFFFCGGVLISSILQSGNHMSTVKEPNFLRYRTYSSAFIHMGRRGVKKTRLAERTVSVLLAVVR